MEPEAAKCSRSSTKFRKTSRLTLTPRRAGPIGVAADLYWLSMTFLRDGWKLTLDRGDRNKVSVQASRSKGWTTPKLAEHVARRAGSKELREDLKWCCRADCPPLVLNWDAEGS